jgi:EAL domain-containing protein (putative c-di-GMP-specific phosphodiesterase class I)
MISPAEFIPVAESSGLIVDLGSWVIDTACWQLAQWALQPHTSQLELSVNVSPRQFLDQNFERLVAAALADSGADPSRLKLEITESVTVESIDETLSTMTALKALGISLSLDDFGTGYSSLSQLKRLPLDQLKIDQGFVRDLLEGETDATIVRTIIGLARNLGLEVIAEGVETWAQREFLEQHGCHAFQGYLFSRALPAAAFEGLVAQYFAAESRATS